MVQKGHNLRQAALELEIPLTSADAEKIQRRKTFQSVIWTERQRFFQEIGRDPMRTKEAVLGRQEFLIQKLIESGDYDKAAQANVKLAQMEGWSGADSQVNIFAGLTAKDIEEAKKFLNEQAKGPTTRTPSSPTVQ
jgi:hypothetical protein